MNFLKKLFGSESAQRQQHSLVAKLTSNDDATFISGLTEAVKRADSGDYDAVKAMHEAMRMRSGQMSVSFHKPGVVITQGFDRWIDAKPQLIQLASRQALLENPESSGDLLSAFFHWHDEKALHDLAWEIRDVGGTSEFYSFQLLFNEMRCSSRFNHDE